MKIKKVKPLLNHIITTANVYNDSDINDISDNIAGQFKEYQTVISVGPNVSTVKPGDVVVINPQAYARPVHKKRDNSVEGLSSQDEVEMMVQFPIITIDDKPCLFLYDRDIEFIIVEMEEDDNNFIM